MNAQPYLSPGELGRLTAKCADDCLSRGVRRHATLGLLSTESVQGHFRTARSVSREIMPDVPRPYRLEDPPRTIDPSSLNERSLGEQMLLQTLRCRQRVFEAELHFTLLLDASRSMLALEPGGHLKLGRLYTWATAFLTVAGWARFHMQVVAGNELRLEGPLRGRDSRRLLNQVLSHLLPQVLHTANLAHQPYEPATVRVLMEAELRHKRRGLAVLISDFLDNAQGYLAVLRKLSATHRIVLVDVATKLDREFKVPHWWEIHAQGTFVREGARHLERVLEPQPILAQMAKQWNTEQQENLAILELLGRPREIRRLVVDPELEDSIQDPPQAAALRVLKQLS